MLYKLGSTKGKFDKIEAVPFKDFANFGNKEKDLENLIAQNILEVLFEDASLMPIFQERQYQAEADIYALNEDGDMVIFELKRSGAEDGAVHQALRYAEKSGQWSYARLNQKYQNYQNNEIELTKAHQEAFNLEHPLDEKEFNSKQHIIIIGSAANNKLITSVDYWKKKGLSIDFLPYRVYELGDEKYFEFFALPYDKHINPGNTKGVLFDTNRSYNENSIWYMMDNSCIAAFGDAKRFVKHVNPGDIVFFSHKWEGLVAAAKVKNTEIKKPEEEIRYREVEFITPIPEEGKKIKAMPFKKVSKITDKSFFWARTIKVPYLSKEDAEKLAKELKNFLEKE